MNYKRDFIIHFYKLGGYSTEDVAKLLDCDKRKVYESLAWSKRDILKKNLIGKWIMKQEKYNLDDVLANMIVENCKAMNEIVKTAQNEEWCKEQNANSLGILYDKISNFSVQLLQAAGQAERSNSSEEED
jgi:hypothetical protein